jgi:hypothetical protein
MLAAEIDRMCDVGEDKDDCRCKAPRRVPARERAREEAWHGMAAWDEHEMRLTRQAGSLPRVFDPPARAGLDGYVTLPVTRYP